MRIIYYAVFVSHDGVFFAVMKITTVRHLWGVDEWDVAFPKIKANGYAAVETCPGIFNETERSSLKALCQKHGLKLVYQIHTGT